MSAIFPADQIIIFPPTPGPEGLSSVQGFFGATTINDQTFEGDDYYPFGAWTRESWSRNADGHWSSNSSDICKPGSGGSGRGASSGGSNSLGTNTAFSRCSIWLSRIDRANTDMLPVPPAVAISVRAGFGTLSQEVFAGTLVADAFGTPTGNALIVKLDNMPLCTQIEIWARSIRDPSEDPDTDVSVSMRMGILADRGGSGGIMDVTMGSYMTGGLPPALI